MAELKTKPTRISPVKFIASITDERTRADSQALAKLMKRVSGAEPKMWGPNIVGFGTYHYKYASGREGDWFVAGFSPRKAALTIYIMGGIKKHEALLKKLGKHKSSSGSCLYVRALEDIDMGVLEDLLRASVKQVRASSS
jgi:hypothetical protein